MMNAVTLAMMDAGLAMKYLPISICIGSLKPNLLIDPTLEEEQDGSSNHTLVYAHTRKNGKVKFEGIVCCESRGLFVPSDWNDIQQLALEHSAAVASFLSATTETAIDLNQTLN
jgi:ribonuclease PH